MNEDDVETIEAMLEVAQKNIGEARKHLAAGRYLSAADSMEEALYDLPHVTIEELRAEGGAA